MITGPLMSYPYFFSQYIDHAEATMHVIGKATVPGAFIADLIPIRK